MISAIVEGIAGKFGLRRRSNRWVGPCPKCGGGSDSDKFNIRDDGGFKCYSCQFKGDIITWLREMEQMSCPAAHQAAGIACHVATCQMRGTCSMGDGSGKRPARLPLSPKKAVESRKLASHEGHGPQSSWQQWANALQRQAAAELAGQKAVMTWLAKRGINAEAARRFGLGWNRENINIDRGRIGLPPTNDGKTTLWVPVGLVIPIFDGNGNVHRIRVRRPGWCRKSFLPKLKYVWLEGSGNEAMVIMPVGCCRGAVVLEAELDAIATAAWHDEVLVIALGTVSGPITQRLAGELDGLPVILVALDADGRQDDGNSGAGPQAVAAWLARFRQAKFWPVPAGKDPGDYVREHGGDLLGWVEAGLVPLPQQAVFPAGHEAMICPDGQSLGEKGNSPAGGDIARDERQANGKMYAVALLGGREFYAVEEREDWQRLAGDGKVVFSGNELSRLREALSGVEGDERQQALETVLDIKDVFPGAYIRRGGSIK